MSVLSGPPLKEPFALRVEQLPLGLAGQLSGPPLKGLDKPDLDERHTRSGRTIVRPSIEG